MPEAKPRDTNIPRVLLLLVNDSPNLLVPKAKPRDNKNISYYYFYSANVLNHLIMKCYYRSFVMPISNVRSMRQIIVLMHIKRFMYFTRCVSVSGLQYKIVTVLNISCDFLTIYRVSLKLCYPGFSPFVKKL